MDEARLEQEIDLNFDYFRRNVAAFLAEHRGAYALLRDQRVHGFFGEVREASAAGRSAFPDGLYSIQEVRDGPIDLGFFSHVGR